MNILSPRPQKGQFLLLFSFMILFVLLLALPKEKPLIQTFSSDLHQLADNLVREFPRAFNFGINESSPASRLANFSRFSQQAVATRFVNLSHLWVFSESVGTSVNLTAGNFLGWNVTVSLNLSGTVQNITVPHNTTNNTVFAGIATTYNLTVQAGADTATMEWPRDKNNIVVQLALKRQDEYIKEEITA